VTYIIFCGGKINSFFVLKFDFAVFLYCFFATWQVMYLNRIFIPVCDLSTAQKLFLISASSISQRWTTPTPQIQPASDYTLLWELVNSLAAISSSQNLIIFDENAQLNCSASIHRACGSSPAE